MLTIAAWTLLLAVAVPNLVIAVELLAGARPALAPAM